MNRSSEVRIVRTEEDGLRRTVYVVQLLVLPVGFTLRLETCFFEARSSLISKWKDQSAWRWVRRHDPDQGPRPQVPLAIFDEARRTLMNRILLLPEESTEASAG